MRQIDHMTPQEIETLALKGMTASRTPHADAYNSNRKTVAQGKPAPNKAQHSPLPWHDDADEQGEIYDNTGCCIADNLHPSNAALIIRAVNNSQKLAACLRAMLDCVAWNRASTPLEELQSDIRKSMEALAAYESEAQ